MTYEAFDEKIDRLELMADPSDTKWDLSDNDRAAIRALLESYRRFVRSVGKALAASAASDCRKAPVGWKCTRELGHDGPCAAISVADDYVAWMRYESTGNLARIVVCDSDSEGAFKVYRR